MNHDGVLLLGGAGFIGSALASRLQHEKMPVHIVGRHDADQLAQLLPQCSTVIHLASATTPGSSARQASLELGNLALTLRLLDLLRAQPQTHLIFFSSGGTVYGNPQRLPVTEDSPIAPLSNHGAGKAAQESFCQALRAQGHAVTILRPSNAYGPGQTMKSGFGLVRTLLEHARLGTAMEIWGDGENVRDYIYIDDIVKATLRLIDQPQDSGTYNLGSGMGYSINQVKEVVEQVCGRTLHATYRPARGTDVRSVVLDNTRLNTRLCWQPEIGLVDGVARTWEWAQHLRQIVIL
ncbi:MAG: epimerase [Betaproteobacteria bacterium HGW-Betaproteobacteria-18]|nr:MAG: epimerase [Betaproteobacteria bacterium HGW-Betaproteobacteria-18]